MSTPTTTTQVAHPGRATLRTAVAAALGLLPCSTASSRSARTG